MTFGVSLILIAVGAIMTWAIHPEHPGSVNVHTVGVILMVVGFVAFLLDLLLWSEWGPGYMRRRAATVVVDDGYAEGYPVRRAAPYRRRRQETVVEDDVAGPAVPPP
jgi:hypothetical protein